MKPAHPPNPAQRPDRPGRRALMQQGLGALAALGLPAGAPAAQADARLAPAGLRLDRSAAARWLGFCTFGPTEEEIEAVHRIGPAAWLDQQLDAPPSRSVTEWIDRKGPPGREDARQSPHFDTRLQAIDWKCIWAPDAVRQRVSYALSQIFVVSEVGADRIANPYAYAHFWDLLNAGATGNFRQLIEDVSASLDMAFFLTYLNNRKADEATGRQPDENYARELMQLFTIGLWELEEDGSQRLDADGRPIPTYGQQDIVELARVFTGFYSDGPRRDGVRLAFGIENHGLYGPAAWSRRLSVKADEHAPESTTALKGRVRIPAGTEAYTALGRTLDALFKHPSCPPFIALNLIRRLSTSNPSPAYVRRVVAAFKDNGQGQRGDMKAVLRAVFLDPELFDPPSDRPFGRMTEPYVSTIALARQLGAHCDAEQQRFAGLWHHKRFASQRPFTAPTVFNFNQPDFAPQGPIQQAGLVAPELQNCDEYGATLRFNGVGALCEGLPMTPELLERLATPAHDAELLDRYALQLCGKTLPARDRAALLAELAKLPRGRDATAARTQRLTVLASMVWFITVHPENIVRQ
ncbi:DUF1800 family protein [Piscinibacter sp. Jin2]|uniref:DUF1800 family protein n=1 Tax=Aquariibacter lacus TaxID=2801332 RepID=A0A9X0XAY3_9BURK|nr:DUF1800 family protein [Piscinibacter lacus]MBL0718647.1 DUF1800 family protein [Piscinibacter lacus]